MKLFFNARVVAPDGVRDLCVLTEKNKIAAVAPRLEAPDAEKVDCGGLYLSPGFTDLHVHGGGGYSAMSDSETDIIAMCRAHARHGVTSIVPTTLAAPVERLRRAVSAIARAQEKCVCSNILGAHLEGPFLNPKKCGAQSPENLLLPTPERIEALLDCGPVRMIGAAPELPGGMLVGEMAAARGIVASVAHSDADFETAEEALAHGYSDVTHIFSACSAMHKEGIFRKVGVAEAGLALEGYTAQFIGDLKHLPAGALKLIYRCKGASGAYPVSDGLEFSACDLAEGQTVTQENGMTAVYEDGVMLLGDRSCLAGSASSLDRMVKNLTLCGVPLQDAVTMASLTPLRVLGLDGVKGRVLPGYDADLILFDEDVRVKRVFVNGAEQDSGAAAQ